MFLVWLEEQLHYVCVTALNHTAGVQVLMTGNGRKHTVTLPSQTSHNAPGHVSGLSGIRTRCGWKTDVPTGTWSCGPNLATFSSPETKNHRKGENTKIYEVNGSFLKGYPQCTAPLQTPDIHLTGGVCVRARVCEVTHRLEKMQRKGRQWTHHHFNWYQRCIQGQIIETSETLSHTV